MNITDVDDRIIKLAAEAGQRPAPPSPPPTSSRSRRTWPRCGMERPEVVPRATEHIPEMVDLIGRLHRARPHLHRRTAASTSASPPSRSTAGSRASTWRGSRPGARVDTDKYDKENARDFVLWKAKADEPAWAQWDAPFGRGRPGWHIECSAMSMKYLGETFDLHCGGVDLIFPHHENEIAQSECGTGQPFVRHWMHVEHLLVDDETMSKSKGNVFTIPELVAQGHRPEAIRYLLLAAALPQPAQLHLGRAAAGGGRAASASTASCSGSPRWSGRAGRRRGRRGRDRRRATTFDARARGRPQHAGGAGRRARAGGRGQRACWPAGR